MEMTPPRISSNDMARSQPVADDEIKTGRGKEAETDREKHDIEHCQSLRNARNFRASPSQPECGSIATFGRADPRLHPTRKMYRDTSRFEAEEGVAA
jgi:hypothetical protein